jgi:uncharacterized protein YbaR (Trm112 family)
MTEADKPAATEISDPAAPHTARMVELDPHMLELLVCPLSKGPLVWDAEKSELRSRLARLAYPVRDGIPILLPSEARQLAEDE